MQVRQVSLSRLKTGSPGQCERLASFLRVTLGGLLACALLASCSVVNKAPVESRPWPTPDFLPGPIAEPQVEKTPVIKKPVVSQTLPPVAILLSDDVPAYRRIADELVARLPDNPDIFSLQGNPAASALMISKLNASGRGHVVAIGPLAEQTASRLTSQQTVFCQVFNHQDHGLTAARMRGVSMLPPAELQFSAWKEIDAGLQRVGVITGPGHEALMARAHRAAQRNGIELIHREVNSDKEMLYTFKRLTPEIQGLWLLPDDRILSRRVLRDIMEYSIKHRKQVMVFHPELLRFGGLLSVSGIEADIAEQVIAALRASSARTASPASELLPLTKIHVEVNEQVAQQLRIPVTSQPQVVADVP